MTNFVLYPQEVPITFVLLSPTKIRFINAFRCYRSTLRTDRSERMEVEHTTADDEIVCTNCGATKKQLTLAGKAGRCCGKPFWTVPYHLIMRSLPYGEDR